MQKVRIEVWYRYPGLSINTRGRFIDTLSKVPIIFYVLNFGEKQNACLVSIFHAIPIPLKEIIDTTPLLLLLT